LKSKPRFFLLSAILFINLSIGVANAQQAAAPSILPPSEIYGPVEASIMSYDGRAERDRQARLAQKAEEKVKNPYRGIVFRHGDVSWLPALATQAGWPQNTHAKLEKIVLRESGGCPNRRGGDMVDADCNITGVSEWNHRSDTGLMQINGINYNLERNKWARVCLDLGICTQEPLFDPLTNLRAGYLLYQYSGWGPWDPCTWGPAYAHRCKGSKGD
jgi:hypothetical protein